MAETPSRTPMTWTNLVRFIQATKRRVGGTDPYDRDPSDMASQRVSLQLRLAGFHPRTRSSSADGI